MPEPENLTLAYVRRMDAKLDQLTDALGGLTQRMQAVETGLLELRRETVGLHGDAVQLTHRLDRVETRLACIETHIAVASA